MSESGHNRVDPPLSGNERETLVGFLEYQRETLAWKCSGLTSQQLRTPLHPTNMTLAGILAHMGTVEDFWFAQVMGDASSPLEFWPPEVDDNPEWEWTSGAALPSDELHERWRAACERSRGVLDAVDDLGSIHAAWGGKARVSARWILTHMIEEYARHNGHADLLRENIDGETGE